MSCKDCDKKSPTRIKGKGVVSHFPSGFTGNRMSVLRLMLPENPASGTYYSLPKIMEDGTVIYAEEFEGQTPPPEINGYVRSPDDSFRFLPQWDECQMRIIGLRYNRVTGAINITMICNHPECKYSGRRLTVLECRSCEQRLEIL